ncbi:MAG TPA: ABC transporter permease subunit, partial [Ignavibacteria bacterium]|nr:ABC transporter permease subunit [Ignavibacteria bacterium]
VAYIVMIVFISITGWFFTKDLFVVGLVTMRGVFDLLPLMLMFFIPAMTMRTFSDEKKSGTLELLLTKPVSDLDIVTGKFLAVLAFTGITLVPTLVYMITLAFLGPLSISTVLTSYLALLLMSSMFISIGIFCSSLTEYQVVAFIVGFFILLPFILLNKVLVFLPASLASFFEYISADFHYQNIAKGVLDTRSIIYFISGTAVFIVLTLTSLAKRKW